MGVGEDGLTVKKIRYGTVIDHIPVGRALTVLRILGVKPEGGYRIAILMNVESRKIGRKDIVKIENLEIGVEETNRIALIAPEATVNIVKDYRVDVKRKVKPPHEIRGVLRCINPTCITRQERETVTPVFRMVSGSPLEYQCIYCGTIIGEREILEELSG